MTDLERAKVILRPVFQQVERSIDELWDIVGRNQNPGCGGDSSMTLEEWNCLRGCADCLKDFAIYTEGLNRRLKG